MHHHAQEFLPSMASVSGELTVIDVLLFSVYEQMSKDYPVALHARYKVMADGNHSPGSCVLQKLMNMRSLAQLSACVLILHNSYSK